jgi:hypothetical protein
MNNKKKLKYLPIDDIVLDMKNPRIAKWIEMYGDNPSADQISLALGVGESQSEESGTTFQSLKASIRANGGIIHPIIVNCDENDKLVVIEGNTRVAIYKEFRKQEIEGDWDSIPSVIHNNLCLKEIDSIRLQSHLVGPRAWDPYSKAKYLDDLSNSKHLTIAQIVAFCGGKESEVVNYIKAYQDMETHYRPQLDSDEDFDPTRFSGFVELQKPRVLNAISNAGFGKDDFAKWIIFQNIHKNEAVRSLPKILGNVKSREVFLTKGKRSAEKALLVLETPSSDAALKEASLEQIAAQISKSISTLSYPEFTALQENIDSDTVQTLIEAKDDLTQLCGNLVGE